MRRWLRRLWCRHEQEMVLASHGSGGQGVEPLFWRWLVCARCGRGRENVQGKFGTALHPENMAVWRDRVRDARPPQT